MRRYLLTYESVDDEHDVAVESVTRRLEELPHKLRRKVSSTRPDHVLEVGASRSIAVGTDELDVAFGAEDHPGLDVDGVFDEPDAAVGHRQVHPARMPTVE
jgi:hypothetical protein